LCASYYARFDSEFILQTDASDFGVGAVLSQVDDDGREKVVAYASKALSARQNKFSATEKEAYAIVFGTQQFHVYLLGRHFQIVMDHNALRWLHSMEPKGRLACWIIDLQEFNFTVVYRAGRLHTNTDALSRLVQPPGEQEEQASATATTTCHNSPASTESEVVKGAIYFKK
jgi:phospholipid-translocating ATPase